MIYTKKKKELTTVTNKLSDKNTFKIEIDNDQDLNTYHYVKFIKVTMNETMFCQTNNNTENSVENSFWILQFLHLHTVNNKYKR